MIPRGSITAIGCVAVLGLLGCKSTDPCTAAGMAETCTWNSDSPACRAAQLIATDDIEGRAGSLLGVSGDSALDALFDLDGKTLVDTEPSFDGHTFERAGFAAHLVTAPIDWSADPEKNITFRFWFQNLSWLSQFGDGEQFSGSLESGAAVLLSYERSALLRQPAIPIKADMTWYDHAIPIRVGRVSRFVERYVADRDELSRPVLQAAARIILSHVYALAADGCYTRESNHGAAQDVALLQEIERYPELRDADELRGLGISRFLEQVDFAVSPDGIHQENSPGYQVYFTELVTQALAAVAGQGSSDIDRLAQIRRALFEGIVVLLQPNLTFPQFGDTENRLTHPQLEQLLEWVDGEAVEFDAAERLRWLLTGGASGAAPTELDRVFVDGGFAAFRSSWEVDAFVFHLTCGYKSDVHYQRDEGSFELIAYGRELVVDGGIYSYDFGPFADYQRTPQAQNTLSFDDLDYSPAGSPTLIDLGSTSEGASAACEQRNYESVGVRDQRRTVIYERDGRLTVVDAAALSRSLSLAQRFTLHPDLDEIAVEANTVTARSSAGSGPTVTFTAREVAVDISAPRGQGDGDGLPVAGWWFPLVEERVATTQLIFNYGERTGSVELAVDIVVTPPADAN